MMTRQRLRGLAFCTTLALLCACGGSGSLPTVTAVNPGTANSASANARVTLTFAVPRTSSAGARTAQYISPSTASIDVTVTPAGGGSPVTATVPCPAPQTSCSVTMAAPVGEDVFRFDAVDGANKALATGKIDQTIVANQLNTINATLSGVIASIVLSMKPPSFTGSVAATAAVTATAADADGNTIAGTYDRPIAVTSSDGANFTLSTGQTTASGQTITLSYNGAPGTGGTILTASASGVPSASLAVASGSYPSAGSFTYAGTIAQNIVRPQPAPSSTQPPYNYSATVAQNTTVSSGATFNGRSGLTDFFSTATVTGIPLGIQTSTHSYMQTGPTTLPTPAGNGYFQYGTSETDSNSAVFQTVSTGGNGQLLDIVPEVAGTTWSNGAALSYNETDGDGTTVIRTVNADGSYTETDNYVNTQPETLTANPDDSGQFILPATVLYLYGTGLQTLTFSAPDASNSIVISQSGQGTLIKVPAWYAAGTPLYRETDVDNGPKPIPATCATTAGGTTGTQLVQTIARIDPVLGTADVQTTTSYVSAAYGAVCTQLSDVVTAYYDYTGQTNIFNAGNNQYGNIWKGAGSPQQITTTTQTLGLTGSSPTAALRSASSVAAPLTMSIGVELFRRVLAKQRAARIAALHAFAHTVLEHPVR